MPDRRLSLTDITSIGNVPSGSNRTVAINPNINTIIKRMISLKKDIEHVLGLKKTVSEMISDLNTQQDIRNRNIINPIYKRRERQQFWNTPYDNIRVDSDWSSHLNEWNRHLNLFLNEYGIENLRPGELKHLSSFVKTKKPIVKYMKSKCNDFIRQHGILQRQSRQSRPISDLISTLRI